MLQTYFLNVSPAYMQMIALLFSPACAALGPD